MKLVALVIAAVSGCAMAVQGSLNTALGKVVGLLEATFVVHITGTLFVLLLLVAVSINSLGWSSLVQAPWYTYLGGVLGVGIVYAVVTSIAKVGVAAATTAIVVGQISTASLVDHFGWFGLPAIPFSIWKGAGILFMALGVWLLLHK